MIELILKAFEWIKNMIRQIIKTVFDFALDCINWFQSLRIKNSDIPFVADAKKWEDLLGQAPERDCGIFMGVFDEESGEITQHKYVAANNVDQQTKEAMNGEDLIILE